LSKAAAAGAIMVAQSSAGQGLLAQSAAARGKETRFQLKQLAETIETLAAADVSRCGV